MIHRDLAMDAVKEAIIKRSEKCIRGLENHVNHLAINLLDNRDQNHQLKRSTLLDLLFRFM